MFSSNTNVVYSRAGGWKQHPKTTNEPGLYGHNMKPNIAYTGNRYPLIMLLDTCLEATIGTMACAHTSGGTKNIELTNGT